MEEVLNQSLKKSVPIFLLMMALALVRINKGLNWAADFSVLEVVVGGFLTVGLYTSLCRCTNTFMPLFCRVVPIRTFGFIKCRRPLFIATRR